MMTASDLKAILEDDGYSDSMGIHIQTYVPPCQDLSVIRDENSVGILARVGDEIQHKGWEFTKGMAPADYPSFPFCWTLLALDAFKHFCIFNKSQAQAICEAFKGIEQDFAKRGTERGKDKAIFEDDGS